MKSLVLCALLCSLANASDVVTDQNLTPKCTVEAIALANRLTNNKPGNFKMDDIYITDEGGATPENPTLNTNVQVESYLFDNVSGVIYTTLNEVSARDPRGVCAAFLYDSKGPHYY